MVKGIFLLLTVIFIALTISACGGSSSPTVPVAEQAERVLGILPAKTTASVIAFTRALFDSSNPDGINRELFIMGLNGGNQYRLTNNKADDDYPAFSPNGIALAFVSNRDPNVPGVHEVFRMNTPWNIMQLTHDGPVYDSTAADWAPGMIVAAQNNVLSEACFPIVHATAIDPTGQWEENISTGQIANWDTCLSRDGKYLCFACQPFGEVIYFAMDLYLMDLEAGTPAVRITNMGEIGSWDILPYAKNPAFDFSCHKIVFETNYWGMDAEVAYIDLNDPTLTMVRVTDNPADDWQPCWGPTGNWVAFASSRDGNFEIYRQYVGPEDIAPPLTLVRLTKTPEDESNPDWSGIMWHNSSPISSN